MAGRQGSLPGAFTFVTPVVGPNTAPTVQPLQAQGTRPNQPPAMADLRESIPVTTTVTDLESAADQLTFQWTASVGTIEGTGQSVMFRAPDTLPQTPVTSTVTLTVIERYFEAGPGGLPVEREHRISQSIEIRVHDSPAEVAAMGKEFLTLFSDSSLPAATVVAQFTDTCSGKQDEFEDVVDDHRDFEILSFFIGDASPVTVQFGGVCAFRGREGDACAYYPVRWTSRARATGVVGSVEGVDQVAAVYVGRRWWLCDSQFLPSDGSTTSATRVR